MKFILTPEVIKEPEEGEIEEFSDRDEWLKAITHELSKPGHRSVDKWAKDGKYYLRRNVVGLSKMKVEVKE